MKPICLVLLIPLAVVAQEYSADGPGSDSAIAPANAVQPATPTQDKRIFGVLPNYRTAEDTGEYHPLIPAQKFHIAYKDSFDWPVYLVSGAFASLYQLEDSNPSFGQGLKGYGKRYVASYADQAIGNFLAEGLFPSVLHEDTRYFRHPDGTTWARTRYAVTRVLITRTDAGRNRFNFSELVGNSTAVAISNAYYPDSRTVSDNVQKLGVQFATDAFANVLKEFWPDIKRKFFSRHSDSD